MHLSYWEKKELYDKDQIVIIGSGIVGLTTAIYLKSFDPDIPILIVERGRLPLGASTKNAGFACFGSVSEILADLNSMSRQEVRNLVGNRYNGLKRLMKIVPPGEIEYDNDGGYEIFTDDQKVQYEECLANITTCCELVEEATGLKESYQLTPLIMNINSSQHAIFNPYEGKLNPMKLVRSLIKKAISMGVRILNGVEISEINYDDRLLEETGGSSIPYYKLMVCTNGFASQLFDELEVKPVRNQVLITEPIDNLTIKGCYHYNKGYVYFRDYQDRLLLGGGRDIAMQEETTSNFGQTDRIKQYLLSFMYDVLRIDKSINVDHWWSGILGVGPSKSTIVDEYRKDHFIGVRMGGMGVALGSEVGYKLASMLVMK